MSDVMEEVKEPIVEQCMVGNTKKPCERITKDNLCHGYIKPAAMWRRKSCPMATNMETEAVKNKVRVGQQKQKKK